MPVKRKDGEDTRRRLLDAGAQVFAEKGYSEATVADICRRASANIAAANYHFGSKAELYVAAWRHARERSLEAHPPDGGLPPGASAEERLRGRIKSIMRRILDPRSYDFDIMHKEMAGPTGLLAETMHRSLAPLRLEVDAILRELLGQGATKQMVRLCRMSIMAQCFGPLLRERRRRTEPPTGVACRYEPLGADVAELAEHVTRFSLAGISQMRADIVAARRGSRGGGRP